MSQPADRDSEARPDRAADGPDPTGWSERQASAFRSLTGRAVVGWVGEEMALRENGPSGLPEFHDPTIPFLQICSLSIHTSEGLRRVTTYQHDHGWGLCIDLTPLPQPMSYGEGSIYRSRALVELPRGVVSGVAIERDGLAVVEVRLRFDRLVVILQAGEVYENEDGTLTVVRRDESILVSVEPRGSMDPG